MSFPINPVSTIAAQPAFGTQKSKASQRVGFGALADGVRFSGTPSTRADNKRGFFGTIWHGIKSVFRWVGRLIGDDQKNGQAGEYAKYKDQYHYRSDIQDALAEHNQSLKTPKGETELETMAIKIVKGLYEAKDNLALFKSKTGLTEDQFKHLFLEDGEPKKAGDLETIFDALLGKTASAEGSKDPEGQQQNPTPLNTGHKFITPLTQEQKRTALTARITTLEGQKHRSLRENNELARKKAELAKLPAAKPEAEAKAKPAENANKPPQADIKSLEKQFDTLVKLSEKLTVTPQKMDTLVALLSTEKRNKAQSKTLTQMLPHYAQQLTQSEKQELFALTKDQKTGQGLAQTLSTKQANRFADLLAKAMLKPKDFNALQSLTTVTRTVNGKPAEGRVSVINALETLAQTIDNAEETPPVQAAPAEAEPVQTNTIPKTTATLILNGEPTQLELKLGELLKPPSKPPYNGTNPSLTANDKFKSTMMGRLTGSNAPQEKPETT